MASSQANQILRSIEGRVRNKLGLFPPKELVHVGGRELFLYRGTWRPAPDYDDAWLQALCCMSKSMVDCGSNVGQASLLALLSGVERLVLVEAAGDSLSLAVDNLVTNFPGVPITALRAFVSDRDHGVTKMYAKGTGAANSMFKDHAKSASRHGVTIEVPNITLDTIVERTGTVPQLVKIDIEGAESIAFAGSIETARRFRPLFLVEMHSNAELSMAENGSIALRWCETVGYKGFYLRDKVAFIDPAQISDRGRCHILFLPQDGAVPEMLASIRQGDPLRFPD